MTPKELKDEIEKYFPLQYSDEYCKAYDAYDNSGLLIDSKREINKIVFSLDLSLKAVEFAIDNGAEAIVTHHPAIYLPIKQMGNDDTAALMLAAANKISVYSAHLNADTGEGGIDESLSVALGAVNAKIAEPTGTNRGYGRIFEIEPTTLGEFVKTAKARLNAQRVTVYGESETVIKSVGSFCGGGSGTALKFEKGLDLLVTSDMPHHVILPLVERGKGVVLFTHYAAENYGFEKIYERVKRDLKSVACLYFTDKRFL